MPDVNPTKPFWKSKICLLNAAAACVAVFADWPGNPQNVISGLALAKYRPPILHHDRNHGFTSIGVTC